MGLGASFAGLDYVDNGVNGARVQAGSVDALYEAMKTLVQNPEMARRWGMKSRDRARSLTPESGAEKWIRVVKALMAS